MLAAELSGDQAWFARWVATVDQVALSRGQPSPVTFCTTCCAESSVVHGDYASAEKQLHVAVVELDQSGWRPRCVPPGTKLAELYLNQGRLEEAERAIGEADDEMSLLVRARISCARGQVTVAATLAERVVRRVGVDNPLAVPSLAVLVEAQLAAADPIAAADTVARGRCGVEQVELCRDRVFVDRPARISDEFPGGRAELEPAVQQLAREFGVTAGTIVSSVAHLHEGSHAACDEATE